MIAIRADSGYECVSAYVCIGWHMADILRPDAVVEIKFPARTLRNQIHQRGGVPCGTGGYWGIGYCQKYEVFAKKYKMGTKLPGSRDIAVEVQEAGEDSPRQKDFFLHCKIDLRCGVPAGR